MAAALFKAAPGGPRPHPLALEPEAPLVEEPAAPPLAPLGDPRTTRYAGAFLLYAALARVDLWGVFRRLAVTTGPARWYGWAHTVAAIVCGFGLRFRSIEDLKNALRAVLGVLLGTAQAPTVLVLRQKIKALAESVVPGGPGAGPVSPLRGARAGLGRGLLRGRPLLPVLRPAPDAAGLEPAPPARRPGHTDVYLHDARGRVLFFVSPNGAHALEALLRDLNQDQARLFSDGPILHFTLTRSTYQERGRLGPGNVGALSLPLDDKQRTAPLDRLTGRDIDFLDCAARRGHDRHLHLQGLDVAYAVSLFDLAPLFDMNPDHPSPHGGLHNLFSHPFPSFKTDNNRTHTIPNSHRVLSVGHSSGAEVVEFSRAPKSVAHDRGVAHPPVL